MLEPRRVALITLGDMGAGMDRNSIIDTSIVMATCSRAEMLRHALESLVTQSWDPAYPLEIVVVNDASTDNTADVLLEFQRTSPIPFTILRGEGRGVAAARNLGCRHARGTWIASFDDDQIASPFWLRDLRRLAEATHAACVGGALALQLPDGANPEDLGPRVRRILGEHLPSDQPFRYTGSLHPATNNVLILREIFLELGGYNVNLTQGGEDKDFFMRVASAGHDMWYQPYSPSLHVMTPRRLEPDNLRWTSMRIGTSDALVEHANRPFLGPLLLMLKRAAATLLRDTPQLIKARRRKDIRAELDVLCSIWHTKGLLLALRSLFSRSRKSSAFLDSMDFRARNGERKGYTLRTTSR